MAGTPRARSGQIKCQWGKLADADPDLVLCWGDGTAKADANLLHHALSSKDYSPMDKTWHPSLLEELEARGYDLATLKISVEKKKAMQGPKG